MSYLTTVERIGIERGKIIGITGILLFQLEFKFKEIPNEYRILISRANIDSLNIWGQKILTAEKIDEVFED